MLIPVCQYGKRQTRILSDAIWGMQINTQKSKRILSKIETGTARNRKRRKEREGDRNATFKWKMPKAKTMWKMRTENGKLQAAKWKTRAEHRKEKRREKLKNWRCKCCGKCEAAAKDASLRMRQHGQFIHNMRRQTDTQCIGAIKCIWHRCCICIYENRKFDYATAASGKRQGACGKCNCGSRRPKLSKFKPGGNHERQQQ